MSEHDDVDPNDGFELDMHYVDSPKLLGGEQFLVILVLTASAMTASIGIRTPNPLWCFIAAAIVLVGGVALLQYAYRRDPQMSKTLPRFLAYGKFIPAHDGLDASAFDRSRLLKTRRKERMTR